MQHTPVLQHVTLCLTFAAGSVTALGQTAPATDQQPAFTPPPYKLFRYDDDYSYLRDPTKRVDWTDDLKDMSLDEGGDLTLSVGGEARTRYEYYSAPSFGLRGPSHDDFALQRFLLHGDLQIGDRSQLHGRAFVQLLSGLVWGEEYLKAANQDNALDVQQAFGDLVWGDNRASSIAKGDTSVMLRLGRQEMGFGSFRLVTLREPTNARLTFDGVRASLNISKMTFDAFLVRPGEPKTGVFNDGEDDNTTFWGFYSTLPLLPEKRLALDLYYLGLDRRNSRFVSGVGDETRHSFGARIWGRYAGWDHDTEFVFQFGDFKRGAVSEDIVAWTVASNTGYTFENAAWKPRLGLKLNVASGDDDPNDDTLGTFNPLFPRNNYFNDATLLAPYNFFDVHPSITVKPTDTLTLTASWDAFFRYSTDDAVFSPVGIAVPASASDDRFVGSSLSMSAEWAINRHVSLAGSYVHFFKGDVVKDADGKDVDFFGIWLTAKF
ncbi:MAG TPA: alginate export family protein [Phycisphaerales bacterium]|nr:alginate export family protein [Phycisphaerales bacterium]